MQPGNEQPKEEERDFLLQGVLGAIGFVFVLLLFMTAFSSFASGDAIDRPFSAVAADSPPQSVDTTDSPFSPVAADSPPIPITPTTGPPPTTPRDVGQGDAEETTTAPATTSTTSTTTTTVIPNGRPVPDVIGSEVNDAILEIFEWNLAIVRVNEASDEVAEGLVIRTDPPAGIQVAPNSPVTLVVSTGPA